VIASPTADGVLNIIGTDQDDTITVRQIENRLYVDGISESFEVRQLQQIVVDAPAGMIP